jgi:F420-non-reducing hydrogenase iron-sulfur subunit
LLRQFGIDEERCRFDYVSAGEGEKFVNVVTEMVNTLKRLGRLSLGRTRTRGAEPANSLRREV